MDKLNREELQSLFKTMVLSTIEAIIKQNNKAGDFIRGGDYDKEDVALFNKKLLNLVHILYPVREPARAFLKEEYPEYIHVLDFAEKVYEKGDTSVGEDK